MFDSAADTIKSQAMKAFQQYCDYVVASLHAMLSQAGLPVAENDLAADEWNVDSPTKPRNVDTRLSIEQSMEAQPREYLQEEVQPESAPMEVIREETPVTAK